MKISRVEASCLRVPARTPVSEKATTLGFVLVVVHADEDIVGVGLCRDREVTAVREVINHDLRPFLMDKNPLNTENIWNEARWKLGQSFKNRTGVIARAISGVDQALWDIKGKYLRQPIFRLLGGASTSSIECYTTFGLPEFSDEQLVELARQLVSTGHDKLKMRAAAANRGQDIAPDVARVRLVREAVGPQVKLMLDGGNRFNYVNALKLCKRLEPYDLTFFDEPVLLKDVRLMADLRRQTTVPLASRARGDNIWDNRDLIAGGAVDVIQPNVLDVGGYTESLKIAHMAEMYHIPVATGGAYHLQNAHLVAGVSNGWMTEYHLMTAQANEAIFVNPPKPEHGRLALSEKPGIGVDLNQAAVNEYTER
jgi:L-rhamnonate dehydratase